MNDYIKHIFLEVYDFKKRKRFAIEYSWKAVFRIVHTISDVPDLYFVVVSNNYIAPRGLQVDHTQEVLDIKEINKLIHSRLQKFLNSGEHASRIDEYFIVDD